jgi:transcriptional regulator with XRE-family HTH domain
MDRNIEGSLHGVNALSPHEGRLDTPKMASTLGSMEEERPFKEVGQRIKSLRVSLGWDHDQLRDELARLSGGKKVSFSSISRWEGGHAFPRNYIGVLARLFSLKLGRVVSQEWLQFGDAGPPQEETPGELAAALEIIQKYGLRTVPVEGDDESRSTPEVSGVQGLDPPHLTKMPKKRR